MIKQIRRFFKNQKGFTLIELMTVLIILGVILGIGVPKYLRIQVQAEWEADKIMIENMAKAAEVYAVQKNDYSELKIKRLIEIDLIDGNTVLNRIGNNGVSERNIQGKTLSELCEGLSFKFDWQGGSGQVTEESLEAVIEGLIGELS